MGLFNRLFGSSNKEPEHITVDSFTGMDEYKIDPKTLSCSCHDFKKRRKGFKQEDPRRLCKHLLSLVDASGDEHEVSIIEHYKDIEKGYPLGHKVSKDFDSGKVTAFISEYSDYDWMNVFVAGHGYGFHFRDKRWGYRKKPPNAKTVTQWMLKEWKNIHRK